jgi:hypothetical protein
VAAFELWAARAQLEGEPSCRHLVQAGGEHGDGCGAPAPDVRHFGAETDPAGADRDLGEQHGRIVAPSVGQLERVVAELFCPRGDVQYNFAAGFEWGEPDREAGAIRPELWSGYMHVPQRARLP